MLLSRSLINIRKSIGPHTDPCGTPLNTRLQLEYAPSRLTRCHLSESHPLIQLHTKLSIPWGFSLIRSLWRGTLSNALARSKYTVSAFLPASISVVTLSRKTRNIPYENHAEYSGSNHTCPNENLSTENCFHDFTYLTRKANWSIVNFMPATLLYRGETLAVLQSPGTHRDLRKIIVTGTAISSHNAFNIRGDMLSAPAASFSFNLIWYDMIFIQTSGVYFWYCWQWQRCSPAWHHTSCPGLACQFQVLLWTQMRKKSFNISALAFESLVSSPWLSARELVHITLAPDIREERLPILFNIVSSVAVSIAFFQYEYLNCK